MFIRICQEYDLLGNDKKNRLNVSLRKHKFYNMVGTQELYLKEALNNL